MRKVLIVLVLVAGAGYYLYHRTTVVSSEEVQLVQDLQARFSEALNQFTSAVGRSGAIGIATTFDTEETVVKIEKIRKELAELRGRLTEAEALARADKLTEKIEYFCRQNDIRRP